MMKQAGRRFLLHAKSAFPPSMAVVWTNSPPSSLPLSKGISKNNNIAALSGISGTYRSTTFNIGPPSLKACLAGYADQGGWDELPVRNWLGIVVE
jgi:hypothetical protein